MNKYSVYLALSIISLLAVCLFIFVLFRHIEIRKLDLLNQQAEPSAGGVMPKKKKHTKKDDIVILLRVLLIIVLLVILVDEDSRWVTIVISYVLVVFLSLLFLAKGTEVPSSVRQRKWEYLALFSLLIFVAGASIAAISYSALMAKYGKSYFGPARITAYNDENDDDGADDEDDGSGDEDEDDEGDDNNEDDEDDEEENDNEDENEDEENDENDEGDENEDEDENNGEDDRRRLEDGGSGDGDSGDEDNSGDESGSGDSGDEDKGDAEEYAYVKVAWGGAWGCPSNPDKYCSAEIETPCDMWDLDEMDGYKATANWKYWDGAVDERLDGYFSCGYGFEDGAEDGDYNPDASPVYSTGDDDAYDELPYAYIVGDCNTCDAQWAWNTYYRRYQEIQGRKELFKNYLMLAGLAIVVWGGISFFRKLSRRKVKQVNKTELMSGEGTGTMA